MITAAAKKQKSCQLVLFDALQPGVSRLVKAASTTAVPPGEDIFTAKARRRLRVPL